MIDPFAPQNAKQFKAHPPIPFEQHQGLKTIAFGGMALSLVVAAASCIPTAMSNRENQKLRDQLQHIRGALQTNNYAAARQILYMDHSHRADSLVQGYGPDVYFLLAGETDTRPTSE